MSDTARRLFESLGSAKDAVNKALPGLKDLIPEAKAELSRFATLGASELSAALFRGDSFVMYGPGQRAAKVEQEYSVFGPSEPSAERETPSHEMGMER